MPGRTSMILTVAKRVHTRVGTGSLSKNSPGDPKLMVTPVAILGTHRDDGPHSEAGEIPSIALARPPCAFKMTKSDCSYVIWAGGPTGSFEVSLTDRKSTRLNSSHLG